MTNSLIPYSFIPGTKAMASEVNANFIALANAVDEGKTFTTESIEEFNKEFESRLDESLGNKLDTNLSNCRNITNCITEIPQRIKLELNVSANTFTLKSGSEVIVPNGFEEDGITPHFDYVSITADKTITGAGFGGSYTDATICYNVTESNMTMNDGVGWRRMSTETASGSTQPTFTSNYGIWYDTATNLIKYIWEGNVLQSGGLSFPLCMIINTKNQIDSIKDIFNGFGFIGKCTWVDKGVRALFANGRNADGSLKNQEVVTTKCKIRDLSAENSFNGFLNSLGQMNGFGTHCVFNQDEEPTGFVGSEALWYSPKDNFLRKTSDSGATWVVQKLIPTGTLVKAVGETITEMSQPQCAAVITNSAQDMDWLCSLPKPSGKFNDLALGASGMAYRAPANGYLILRKLVTNSQYVEIGTTARWVFRNAASTNSQAVSAFAPMKRGDVATISYNAAGATSVFRFLYDEGSLK